MNQDKEAPLEETLDPEDWAAMKELGHCMVDDMLETMETIRQAPPWQHPPR
jgi:aromatic-L-amino-acid decarboxylase